ncbi:cyclin-dependent kinase C-2 C-like [Salvia hispanica]|uniref:cyclin-dependent kinase C-2 C-like n=1 Tax=Salvia hispanica TaxID=49212 RepID=UPI00200941C2|nr:cyclin-dependent kinase C-2 C-like [Salvia hispanica]
MLQVFREWKNATDPTEKRILFEMLESMRVDLEIATRRLGGSDVGSDSTRVAVAAAAMATRRATASGDEEGVRKSRPCGGAGRGSRSGSGESGGRGGIIDGWVPLRADAYERLDKIGQGTYSNVYRARELKSNRIVAVKKVRFDNFQAESVRFMAREIMILRMLDHPNVMKLEGIITSRLSSTIYLVFEYMEHDLAGLLSCPDITFSESQVKCLMRQVLSGLDHCHSRGIMHRDIKSSNILVNNQGVLKIADFGLAYFTRPKTRDPLTNRVVTLWYRPPELLLGSTNYGGEVDLWSVGCVFAELFMGRPILKGRTEVEQLHKIFRLCGTPPEEYWRTSRLPLASMFKPQHPYDSTLRERCSELPKGAVDLIESLLAIQPAKRGTAASALDSEYFKMRPYACDPSSMPKFPPNKEMDAKAREDERRMKGFSSNSRRLRKESSDLCKAVGRRNNNKQALDTKSDVSAASNSTQDSITSTKSVPVSIAQHSISVSISQKSLEPSPLLSARSQIRLHRPGGSLDSAEISDMPQFSENDQPRLTLRRSRFHKD